MTTRVTTIVLLVTCSLSAAVLIQKSTFAQPQTPSSRNDFYAYQFDDDLLSADGTGAFGYTLLVRPPPERNLLIRPRIQYVTEMLKSVEDM